MIPTKFLTAFVSLALFCTISFAAPETRLEADRLRASGSEVAPGQWFDLLLRIDPKGSAILAKGLEATATEVADFEADKPIYPAPDTENGYTKPFVVRLPVRLV